MRILILKIIKQVIYRLSEHTPPGVKFSKMNLHIACINRDIDEFIKFIKTKTNESGRNKPTSQIQER